MLMVLIGPGLADFEVIAGIKYDENQAKIAAYVQDAVKQDCKREKGCWTWTK